MPGVGGGSLVYANTLYEPLDAFYRDPSWAHITDWKDELAPYYDQAKRMLGVVEYPHRTPSDEVMEKVATDMGVGDTFHPTPVGVFFGGPGQSPADEVADPYFGGAGPDRNPCRNCGECMTGCRHNAKNTLVKNYLYLAEQAGAVVHPLTTVTKVVPLDGGGYRVDTRWTKAKLSRRTAVKTFTAEQVVFSAAALGTQKLLHQLKGEGDLPRISDRLGVLTRTNSEAILGRARARPEHRLHRGGRDHLVVAPRRAHPHRAGALRPGQQLHVADADGAGRRDRHRAAVAHLAAGDVVPAPQRGRPLRHEALVRADRDRAGDADAGQLHHHHRQEDAVRVADVVEAGSRRAEPDVHPGRLRGGTPDGRRSWAGPPVAMSASPSTPR